MYEEVKGEDGITVGVVVAVIPALGLYCRERPEARVFGQADDGRASADPAEVPRTWGAR